MERSKRNKSRQSHKSRTGGNSSETGNGGFNQSSGTSNPDQTGFYQSQQSSHQQQGGLVRSKPCREIYRPPNCRKGRNNNQSSNSGQHYQNYYSYNNNMNSEKQHTIGNAYEGLVKSSSMNSESINNISPETISLSSSAAAQGFRPLNIHAKEFHFKPNSLSANENNNIKSPSPYYGIVSTTAKAMTVGSNSQSNSQPETQTTFYSLCQSKSSGNVANLRNSNGQFEDECVNTNAQINGNPFENISITNVGQYFNPAPGRNITRLQQSKSSGNIPTRNKVVHFVDDGNVSPSQDEGIFDQLLNSTNSLNIRGGNNFTNPTSDFFETQASGSLGISQPRMQFLQKSRTTIQMGIGAMSNQMPNYFFRNSQQPSQRPSATPTNVFLPPAGLIRSPTVLAPPSPQSSQLKRSKSFCVKTSGNKTGGNYGGPTVTTVIPNSPNFGDFCINKWPRAIQESITSAVTGGDRVPPRHRINMVSCIFETLFEVNTKSIDGNGSNKKSTEVELNDKSGQNGSSGDLTIPAVQIFLYFIQREKDHTVMESLLNTCFAAFQSLSTTHGLTPGSGNIGGQTVNNTRYKWNVFLNFLCSFYCQVKCIRIQQQSTGSSIEQISMTVLTLLCDSCLATLRSLPICHSPETMDCLFTVMTSIGRDMEKTFPSKMKQILTSVRDALLGLGPYSALTEAPPVVQKTLMQLIELHAANWHLPASAVRYYYAHPTTQNNSDQVPQSR